MFALRREATRKIERSATVLATPETIWAAVCTPLDFSAWDPDCAGMKNLSGPLANGATGAMVMRGAAPDFAIRFYDVVENESMSFDGAMLGGSVKANVDIRMTPIDAESTKLEYAFEMQGLLGPLVAWLKPKQCIEGTEHGLANMKRLSEEAQARSGSS